jgi:hypothetical protein
MQPAIEQCAALAVGARVAALGLGERQPLLVHQRIASARAPLFVEKRDAECSALIAHVARPPGQWCGAQEANAL